MDTPEQSPIARRSAVSAEGIIGVGVTVGALGVLCALLGSAQWMRLERDCALIFFSAGAVLIVVGAVTAVVGQLRKVR